ncbi:unnamed protein product [Amaranthus hypochondriacus]
MNDLRARSIRRLILLRAHYHQNSVLAYKRIDSPDLSFSESLPIHEPSNRRRRNSHSEKIPRGYLPVYVGPDEKRFIIPMAYLSMPDFGDLMETVAEEFGFEHQGALKIPCDEDDFQEILYKCLANHKATSKSRSIKDVRLDYTAP